MHALSLALAVSCASPAKTGDARRVITAAPSFTEIAFALGRGDRVVGVSDFCERPPRACRLPRIGGLVDPDLERILALRPDLVVLLGDFPEADAPLRRAGVRTLLLDNESIGDVFHVIETLGEALDARESARALARRMRGDLDAVKRRVAGEPRPRVLWVLDRRPGTVQDVFAAGGGSFLTEILEVAGGHSVLADTRQGAIQISTEQLLRSGADVVLDSSSDPAGTLPWRTLPALPAVGNGRLVAVRDPVFTVPGPRIARAAERVARLLHPDLFPTEAR